MDRQFVVTVMYRNQGFTRYGFFPSHEEAREYGMKKVETLRQADTDRPNIGVEAGGIWRAPDYCRPGGFKIHASIDVIEVLPPTD